MPVSPLQNVLFEYLGHALLLVGGGDEVRVFLNFRPALPMTTPTPAHSIMLRSLPLSPKHMTSPGKTPNLSAKSSTAAPFVAPWSVISR